MKKRKLTKKGKKILVIFSLGIILIVSLSIKTVLSSNTIKDMIKETKYYTIKIDLPEIENEPVRKEIEQWSKEKIENLQKISKKNKAYLTKNKMKYELIISNNTNTMNGIKTVQVTSFLFTGGNHYEKDYKTYHYQEKDNQEITLANYFKKDKNYLEKISQLSYFKIKKLAEETGKIVEDNWIKKGTTVEEKNYQNFEFTREGLTIYFSEYQISSWSDGEIKITIEYDEIADYINFKIPEAKQSQTLTRPTRDLTSLKDQKVIAITFDDGPSPKTKILLDGLKGKDWKVTFFTLGSRVKEYPSIIKREYEEGHEVASHTYNHLNLKKLSDYEVYKEITYTNNEIKNITGKNPLYIRPPYGSTNDHIKEIGNMITVLWSVDTEDWKFRNTDDVYKAILKGAQDGGIILLHDIYQTSVEGALKAMATLEQNGYHFVTVEELFKLKNITPTIQNSYFSVH